MEWWLAILVGVSAVLVLALAGPRVACPGCKAQMPRLRRPDGLKQLLWGGWTCRACGMRMDRKGKPPEARQG